MNTEETACIKCGSDVFSTDKFCRHCGEKDPANGVTWDWKNQPPFGRINTLLRPFGCALQEIETNSDQHSLKVVDLKRL